MSAGKIHSDMAKAGDLLPNDRSLSLRQCAGMIDLRVTIIRLLAAKLDLNRSEETVNGLAEPPYGRH